MPTRRRFDQLALACGMLTLMQPWTIAVPVDKLQKGFLDDVVAPVKDRRRGNRKIRYRPHPIKDHSNPADLTARLNPINPDVFNPPQKIADQSKTILKMAHKYGMPEEKLSKMRKTLMLQLKSYAEMKTKQDKFSREKHKFSRAKREAIELALLKKAREVHHDLYKIKVEAMGFAKKKDLDAWKYLSDFANSPDFTPRQRSDLHKEIKEHIKSIKTFHKKHENYMTQLHRGLRGGVLPVKKFNEALAMAKRKVVKHQVSKDEQMRTLLKKVKGHVEL